MKIDYETINDHLAESLGDGTVTLMPDPRGEYPYILRFADDNPGEVIIKSATYIVNQYINTRWLYSKRRRV